MTERRRKNWGPAAGVLLLTILLGPPIGGAVFMLGALLTGLFTGDPLDLETVGGTFVGSVVLSYLPGGLQAIAMGVASAVLVFARGFYSRPMAAGLAVMSNALVLVVLYMREPLTDSFRATLEMFAVFTGLSVIAAMVLWAMFRKLGLIKPRLAAA